MKIFELNTLKEYSIFFWLILISIIGILILSIYSNDKKDQSEKIKSSLDNIYFKKTL